MKAEMSLDTEVLAQCVARPVLVEGLLPQRIFNRLRVRRAVPGSDLGWGCRRCGWRVRRAAACWCARSAASSRTGQASCRD